MGDILFGVESHTQIFLNICEFPTLENSYFSRFLITFMTIFCIFFIIYGCKIEKFPGLTTGLHTNIYLMIFSSKEPAAGEKNFSYFFNTHRFQFFGNFPTPGVFDFFGIPTHPQNFRKFGNSTLRKNPP